MKRYRGYLFDLDGTLIDTAPDLNRAQNAALAAYGYAPASEDDTRHWVGHGARVLLEQALKAQDAGNEHLDALHAAFLDHYSANIAIGSAPYPRVVETLNALRAAGSALAVVTNKNEALSAQLLEALGLTERFDTLIGGNTAAAPKPDAAPAALACERLQLDASQVLFVGDSTTDVGCARAFGCDIVCVSYGYNQGVAAAELGADAVIDSFSDLLGTPA